MKALSVRAATGSAGVHTGVDDLPTTLVRRVVGPDLLVGRTAHTLAEARAAIAEGADYLGVGPCFPSATKAFGTFAPLEFLRAAADEACDSPNSITPIFERPILRPSPTARVR